MPFMASYHVPEERRAYRLSAGPLGCLFLHGFLGSPKSSRPLAEYLAARNVTVHCPLLPGHGHYPDKLYQVSRRDWFAAAEEAFEAIKKRCEELFIIGHSMGSVLAAKILTRHPKEQGQLMRGVIMLAPAYAVPDRRLHLFRILRYAMTWIYPLKISSLRKIALQRLAEFNPSLDLDDPIVQTTLPEMTRTPVGAIDEMRKTLDAGRALWSRVNVPTLILQGGDDVLTNPQYTRSLYKLLLNQDKQFVVVDGADHELFRPSDPRHREVWPLIFDFIRRRSSIL
jgi:carboxylesterase